MMVPMQSRMQSSQPPSSPVAVGSSANVVRLLEIETPEAVVVRYPLAGLGSRGVAALLDFLVLGLLILAEGVAFYLIALLILRVAPEVPSWVFTWEIAIAIVAFFITYWGYFIVGEVFMNGRTFGKRRMRIRVVREDGSRVRVSDSVVRNLIRVVDMLPGTYALGIASVLLSERAQRLGDMAAGTVVLQEEDERWSGTGLGVEEERTQLVRRYLARRGRLTEAGRYQVAERLLGMYGETPGAWDEPTMAGRLADLAGLR